MRVDVSIDEGKTWITAELSDGKAARLRWRRVAVSQAW